MSTPEALPCVNTLGWKLHLFFDPSDDTVNQAVRSVLQDVHDQGAISAFKLGNGGGAGSGQLGKEATVIVGSHAQMLTVVEMLDTQLDGVLLPVDPEIISEVSRNLGSEYYPSTDVHRSFDIDLLEDDIPIRGDRIWGRFNVWPDPEFSEYGKDGIPFLATDHAAATAESLWGNSQSVDCETISARAQQALVNKFGTHFFGDDAEQPLAWYQSKVDLKKALMAEMRTPTHPDVASSIVRLSHKHARRILDQGTNRSL